MYYNSTNLPAGDTAFIISVVAHLKASSGTTNENKRKVMAQNTMNFLNGYDDNNNYLLSGDFNIYTDQEPAFQQFVNYSNPTLRFYDPLNQMGSWNNNYQYRYVHTQSTHENSNNCAAGGGMDDRFDYILISDNIRKGSKKVKFLPGSYSAVGQDGQHFNKSINASPTNTSVPSNVLNALYHNSDHLPVTLKLVVGENTGINPIPAEFNLSLVNPVKDELQLNISSAQRTSIDIQIIDLTGKLQFAEKLTVSGNQSKHSLPVHQLKPGFYIIRILNGNQVLISKKVVKL